MRWASLLVQNVFELLDKVLILPRRLVLDTPGVQASVPLLRGVWGAALHELDQQAYEQVFETQGQREKGIALSPPGYVLRPAPPDPNLWPAVDWILVGATAIEYDEVLRRAWDVASGMGLGPQRRRFFIRRTIWLGPDEQPMVWPSAWPLGLARWPFDSPERTPCRLVFRAPLRLLRRKRLIEQPTLTDLVVAAVRRVTPFLSKPLREQWQELGQELIEQSRRIKCSKGIWERLDFQRYSGRQRQRIELRGVEGWLELPKGPGPLWPLLNVCRWLHVGKGTVFGLGQLWVEPLEVSHEKAEQLVGTPRT